MSRSILEIVDPNLDGPGIASLVAELEREHGGIYFDAQLGVWVAFGRAEVLQILQGQATKVRSLDGADTIPLVSSEAFSSTKYTGDQAQLMRVVAGMMIGNDGLQATARKPLQGLFTRRRLNADMGDAVVEAARGLLDPHRSIGRMDVVHDFSGKFPVAVIMQMLGLPQGDLQYLKELSDVIAPAMTNPVHISPEAAAHAWQATKELRAYFDRRFGPDSSGDMTRSTLMEKVMSAPGLDGDQRFAQFVLLFIAGHETTNRAFSCIVNELLKSPKKLAALRERPELISSVVREGLRVGTPFQLLFRRAQQPFEIGGHTFGPGTGLPSRVATVLVGANYSHVYNDPGEFQIDRFLDDQTPESVAFGVGPHRCLGAELARLELEVALAMWIDTIPGLSLAGSGTLNNTLMFRGLSELPVTFEPHSPQSVISAHAGNLTAVALSTSAPTPTTPHLSRPNG